MRPRRIRLTPLYYRRSRYSEFAFAICREGENVGTRACIQRKTTLHGCQWRLYNDVVGSKIFKIFEMSGSLTCTRKICIVAIIYIADYETFLSAGWTTVCSSILTYVKQWDSEGWLCVWLVIASRATFPIINLFIHFALIAFRSVVFVF